MAEHNAEKDAPAEDAVAFIRALVNAWDCCATCAGGVLARRDRERDARRDRERVLPPAECANPECDHDRTIPSPGCALRRVTPPAAGQGGTDA